MKDVIGFEALYAVTSCGKIWSYKAKKFLKPKITKNGYLQVALQKNKKYTWKYVHRVVAEAYIQKVPQKNEVNHKDENKGNNCVKNLEWVTHSENSNYGTRNSKISKPVICVETGTVYKSLTEAAKSARTTVGYISQCCRKKRNTIGGFHWKYV